MLWYRVRNEYSSGQPAKKIEIVEIDRFTESSVWIAGKRTVIHGAYEWYYPTLQGAIDYCEMFFQRRLESAQTALEIAEKQITEWRQYVATLGSTEAECDDSV